MCGDRRWAQYLGHPNPAKREASEGERRYLYTVLDDIHAHYGVDCVIEGEARGADTLARLWAEQMEIEVAPYPALWSTFGRAAGPMRNFQMLQHGRPDMVVAFHRSFSTSKGTAHMVGIAREANIPAFIFPSREVPL